MRLLTAAVLAVLALGPAVRPQEAGRTELLLGALERRHRETLDPSDPRAAAARLGFDRARILEAVAALAWEPYEGILRDASGTLLAGGGNSLDRALLLQAMLEAGGERTRLLRADLAAGDAAKLLEAFRARGRKERPETDPRALAGELGLDPEALGAIVAEGRAREAALVDEILEAARTESARLEPLAGPVAGRAPAAPREHVWVQVADGEGWTDLDPSPVAMPRKGGRPLSPQELAARRRGVTFRLVMHRKTGEKVEPVPLLTAPFDLAAVSWKAVDLVLLPLPGQLPRAPEFAAMDEKARAAALRQAKTFRGGLIVDGRYYGGIPFDLSGKLYEVDEGGRIGGPKALGAGLARAFGGAFGGGGKEAPSSLESVVLELAVREPGARERVHRRTLVEPGKSDALPLLRHSFLVDGAPLPQGERGRRELATLARNVPALRKLLRGEREGVHFNQHVEVPSLLLRFADLRRRALARIGEGEPAVQDRPGICAETSQVVLDEAGGRLLVRRGIDILDNPVRFASGARTMAVGIADTALECLLVARLGRGDPGRSAWTAMERARLRGGRAEAADRAGLREIRWSPEAWWSIDPSSGVCVGRVPSGAGQAMLEAAWEHANAVCTYSDVVGLLGAAGGATKSIPAWAESGAEFMGKACGVVGGTWPRDMAMKQIDDLNKDLWPTAIAALSGL